MTGSTELALFFFKAAMIPIGRFWIFPQPLVSAGITGKWILPVYGTGREMRVYPDFRVGNGKEILSRVRVGARVVPDPWTAL
jgi:hypothetical protein